MSRRKVSRIWVEPQDFRDLRRQAGLTRPQAAEALDVTGRTIQNWETGGARIPWMAYRMLRILQGCALPGKDWEGWTLDRDTLYAPNGRHFTAAELQHIEQVFAMSRLWLKDYAARNAPKPCPVVIHFPDSRGSARRGAERSSEAPRPGVDATGSPEVQEAQEGHLKLIGGVQR